MTQHTGSPDPLTPAEIRLAQYGERTSTWSTATYDNGIEKALHEIALGLKTEIDRLRQQRRFLLDQIAKKDARSGEGDRALRKFLGGDPAAPDPICGDENDGDWCELEPGHEGHHRADTAEWAQHPATAAAAEGSTR